MTTLFTDHDLIRYLYGESSENEKAEIEEAAICDPNLGEQLFNLKFDTGILDKLSFSPSDFALEKIFNFSLSYSVNQD